MMSSLHAQGPIYTPYCLPRLVPIRPINVSFMLNIHDTMCVLSVLQTTSTTPPTWPVSSAPICPSITNSINYYYQAGTHLLMCLDIPESDRLVKRACRGINPSATIPIWSIPVASIREHGEKAGAYVAAVCACNSATRWKRPAEPSITSPSPTSPLSADPRAPRSAASLRRQYQK